MSRTWFRVTLGIWMISATTVVVGCDSKSSNTPPSAELTAPPNVGADESPPLPKAKVAAKRR
jgi:hypothetical protein